MVGRSVGRGRVTFRRYPLSFDKLLRGEVLVDVAIDH